MCTSYRLEYNQGNGVRGQLSNVLHALRRFGPVLLFARTCSRMW